MKPERLPAKPPQRPPVTVQESGVRRSSLTALPTSEVTLRPSLIDKLEAIAPKRQRSWLRYVIGLAVVGLLVWMAATPSVRGPIVARARALLGQPAAAPAPDVSTASAPDPAPSAALLAAPSAPAAASASVAAAPTDPPAVAASPAASTGKPGAKKPRRPHR